MFQPSFDLVTRRCEPRRIRKKVKGMEFSVVVRKFNQVPIVHVTGALDIRSTATLRQCVVALVDGGSRRIVINLDRVDYLDSTALGALLGLRSRIEDAGGRMGLCFRNPRVANIFKLTQLDGIFPIADTVRGTIKLLPRPAS